MQEVNSSNKFMISNNIYSLFTIGEGGLVGGLVKRYS